MEAVFTCSAEGQSKLLLILQKMRCVWFKHRQNTVLYCTTVDCTILINTVDHTGLLCRQSRTGRVFGLNLKDECCVVVTYRSSRNAETQLRWR